MLAQLFLQAEKVSNYPLSLSKNTKRVIRKIETGVVEAQALVQSRNFGNLIGCQINSHHIEVLS